MTGFRSTMIKFVIFGLISLILFVMLYNTMTNVVDGDTRTWKARFSSVSGLRDGDDVRVAGVKVGRVEEVKVIDNDEAQVTFILQKEQRIYDSTRLALRYQNLLGQRYLSLTAGKDRAKELSPGDEIPKAMTSPGFDLTALLNGFEPLFNVLQPDQVNKMASNIIAVLQGEGGTVESLLKQTGDAAEYLASRDQVFTQVLQNLTPVLENLSDQSGNFDSTVDQLAELMAGLARQRKVFAGSIDHLGQLMESTSGLLDDIRPDLKYDVSQLRTTAAVLAANGARFGRAVDALPEIFGGLARATSNYSALGTYFCNLGFVVGGQTIFLGGSGGPYSEVCR
jgi:phospholipid/cholesterol/gamma-HCH transport system substrate-binding protein